MSIISILGQKNWLTLNRNLVLAIGLDAAYFLSHLADLHNYYNEKDQLKEGWFYASQSDIEKNAGISRRVQETCEKTLCKLGLLHTKLKGMPATKHYAFTKITDAALIEVLTKTPNYIAQKRQTRLHKNAKQDCTETPNKIAQNVQQTILDNNTKNNNKESSDLKKSPSPALKFLDLFTDSILYLNEKTGRKFEISEQDKKGKTDKFKLVCKVFASGYTLEDVKKVIDAKVGEWLHDSKMVKHLTYSTLFAARNFEKYIEEIKAGETKSDKVAPKNDLIGSIRPQIEEMGYKCQKGTIERIYGELKAKMQSGSTDTEICQKVLLFLGNSESRKYSDLNTILSNFNTILETIKKQKQNGTTK